MSDLQVGLIILGGFIIAGVVVYNWMQERKLRHEVNNEFIVPQKDVLAADFHIDADAYMVDRELAEVTEKFNQSEHASTAKALDVPTVVEPKTKDFNSDVFTKAVEVQEANARKSREVADAEYAAQAGLDRASRAASTTPNRLRASHPAADCGCASRSGTERRNDRPSLRSSTE